MLRTVINTFALLSILLFLVKKGFDRDKLKGIMEALVIWIILILALPIFLSRENLDRFCFLTDLFALYYLSPWILTKRRTLYKYLKYIKTAPRKWVIFVKNIPNLLYEKYKFMQSGWVKILIFLLWLLWPFIINNDGSHVLGLFLALFSLIWIYQEVYDYPSGKVVVFYPIKPITILFFVNIVALPLTVNFFLKLLFIFLNYLYLKYKILNKAFIFTSEYFKNSLKTIYWADCQNYYIADFFHIILLPYDYETSLQTINLKEIYSGGSFQYQKKKFLYEIIKLFPSYLTEGKIPSKEELRKSYNNLLQQMKRLNIQDPTIKELYKQLQLLNQILMEWSRQSTLIKLKLYTLIKNAQAQLENFAQQEDNKKNRKKTKERKTSYSEGLHSDVKVALNFLGLSYPYTQKQLKEKYRLLAKRYHPDSGGKKEDFINLQRNYEILMSKLKGGDD